MQSRTLSGLILLLFFCSGAAALVYEVVWSKFLSQTIGSTVYAQTVVLACFMGGLAIGNRLFGKFADRLRRPVAVYGVVEGAIGVYALAFPTVERWADALFVRVGSGLSEHSGLLLGLKALLSTALLLGPTILMGGTLPLMAGWLQRSTVDAGRRSARFYSINSLGAVSGAWLAGFWLVAHYGMVKTLFLTAALNILIGIAAVLLGRGPLVGQPKPAPEVGSEPHIAMPETLRRAGLIVAVTGGVSMGFEVLASRSLALIFGSSLQSFAIVLMAFILGIGLGSAWIASSKRQIRSSEALIVVMLCLASAWVALFVFNIEKWVGFYGVARTGLGRTEVGYLYNLMLNSGISLVILGVPAALVGAVLPLMIRAMSREGMPLGAHVGLLLTWNTIGAVVGVLLTGFVLMPTVGLRSSFAVLALGLAVVALLLALRHQFRAGSALAGGVTLCVCSLFFFGAEDWRHVITSGVFREASPEFDRQILERRKQNVEILRYEDGPDATVAVEQDLNRITLTINGKPDASTTTFDQGNQLLVGHLPMLVKPDAKDVFMLGLGSGISAGALLAYPVDQVVVAENCAPVIRGAREFRTWNHGVVDDPRARMWMEDGRTALKISPQLYDVIITEPSNPWTAGVGSVFSKEYYSLAASRLKPGGIVAAWFHIYESSDEIALLFLRTFSSVFPYVELWDAGPGDVIMLGSLQPWQTGPEVFRRAFEIERVRTDLWMLDIRSPEALMVRQLASQRTAACIAGPGPIQTDLSPVLEYAAPKAFFMHKFTTVLEPFDERTYQQLLMPTEKRQLLGSLPLAEVQMVFGTFLSMNRNLYNTVMGLPATASLPSIFNIPQSSPGSPLAGTAYENAAKAFAVGNIAEARRLMAYVLQMNPNDRAAAYYLRVFDRAATGVRLP
jgi:predicted membrane-bound spermidine synthase